MATKQTSHKKIIIALLAICAFAGIYLSIAYFYKLMPFKHNETSQQANTNEDSKAKTTSTTKSAQADFENGGDRQPGNTLNENKGESVIKDDKGNIPNDINTSQPISSKTGEITIYTPAQNSLINSGQTIAGTSSLQKVSYRVLDNISGMISTGDLSVVNGKFSGQITYTTNATSGRIDVFASRADGSEYSAIEIPVRFK